MRDGEFKNKNVRAVDKSMQSDMCGDITAFHDRPENAPPLADLPPCGFGTPMGTFACGNGVWQMLFECAAEEDAEGYVAALREAGYRVLSVNHKGVNVFWQLKNEKIVIMAAYIPCESSLRVIAEPVESAVISGVKDEDYEAVCRTQVTQIGLGCDDVGLHNCQNRPYGVSMSYVIRLCDGSFIVYDGGMPYSEYADRLYTVLKSQTELRKRIVIAAWVLTHAHPDHTGVFDLFAEEYASKITVENIVLNFGMPVSSEDMRYQNHILAQAQKFPNARVMKVNVGTDLYFRNAKMEVLFEQTLLAPKIIENLNAATLVTRVELDGKSFMFLADHADYAGSEKHPAHLFNNGAIRRMYGDYLRSDVVQVAHHGLGGGGTAALYELIAAKYALWPVGEEKFRRHNLAGTGANTYFLRKDVKTLYAFDKLQVLFVENGEIRWKEYSSYAAYERDESTVPNQIIPRVKSQAETDERWIPQNKISFCVTEGDEFGQNAVTAAEFFLPSHDVVTDDAADIVLRKLDSAPKAEWYRLTATSHGVLLEYADARGAINAVASLTQMIFGGIVHGCVIEDYPDHPFRGVMLNLATDTQTPFQDIKDMIVHMALSKYNKVQINLLCDGLAYTSDAAPEFCGGSRRDERQYTKKQIRDLMELCALFAIEAIPTMQLPACGKDAMHPFCDYPIQPSLPLFADRLWCADPVIYNRKYRENVYKLMFGKKLVCDLYQVFGSIGLPIFDASAALPTHNKPEDVDHDYLTACMEELAKPGEGGVYQKLCVNYIRLLQNIVLKKYEAAAPAKNV